MNPADTAAARRFLSLDGTYHRLQVAIYPGGQLHLGFTDDRSSTTHLLSADDAAKLLATLQELMVAKEPVA
jgi:hypothetical protein